MPFWQSGSFLILLSPLYLRRPISPHSFPYALLLLLGAILGVCCSSCPTRCHLGALLGVCYPLFYAPLPYTALCLLVESVLCRSILSCSCLLLLEVCQSIPFLPLLALGSDYGRHAGLVC